MNPAPRRTPGLASRTRVQQNRVRSYDVRSVIEALCDTGSLLELREVFGIGVAGFADT